jgi:hypothetical protein
MVDTYIDTSLPYPDAKVAETLCVGGAVKYALRRGSGISEQWILDHVSVHIQRHTPRQVAVVLGTALLWAIYDDELGGIINAEFSASVQSAARQLNSNLPEDMNPVCKIPVIVRGDGGSMTITEVVLEGEQEEANNDENEPMNEDERMARAVTLQQQRRNGGGNGDEVRVLTSTVNALRRQNEEMKNELQIFKSSTNTLLSHINTSIRRLAMVLMMTPRYAVDPITANTAANPRGQQENTNVQDTEAHPTALQRAVGPSFQSSLCKCPKSLHVLWHEYEFGIAGRKPAKMFSAEERGRNKFQYSLRNNFWVLVVWMIRAGYSHNTAIDKIYRVYNTKRNVTQILREIRTDKKEEGIQN